MDAAAKIKMVEKIMVSNDDEMLNEINSLLGLSDKDFWDDLSDSTKASIQKGIEESKQGNTRPHEQVMAEIKARFLK